MGKRQTVSLLLVLLLAAVLWVVGENGLPEVFSPQSQPSGAGVPSYNFDEDGLSVFFLDVGQGDSELIRYKEGDEIFTALIDTGEYAYADGLTEYLQELNIKRIDALICSHQHTDHMGCMARIVQRFEIGSVYMPRLPDELVPTGSAYEALLRAIEKEGMKAKVLQVGANISAPEVLSFEVLSPAENEEWDDLNHYSGVIRLSYGETSFLFTGDAESENERAMLNNGAELQADVLKCGHHGSSTSTTKKFLKTVDPSCAVISCGKDNSYGHPHRETVESLEESGVQICRTDRDGTILIKSDGRAVSLQKGLPSVASAE